MKMLIARYQEEIMRVCRKICKLERDKKSIYYSNKHLRKAILSLDNAASYLSILNDELKLKNNP